MTASSTINDIWPASAGLSFEQIPDAMTESSRRAFMQELIEKATTKARPIDQDAEFMALAELWIKGHIEMAEMRARYRRAVTERLEQRRLARGNPREDTAPYEPFSSADDLLAEIGRITGAELSR